MKKINKVMRENKIRVNNNPKNGFNTDVIKKKISLVIKKGGN